MKIKIVYLIKNPDAPNNLDFFVRCFPSFLGSYPIHWSLTPNLRLPTDRGHHYLRTKKYIAKTDQTSPWNGRFKVSTMCPPQKEYYKIHQPRFPLFANPTPIIFSGILNTKRRNFQYQPHIFKFNIINVDRTKKNNLFEFFKWYISLG